MTVAQCNEIVQFLNDFCNRNERYEIQFETNGRAAIIRTDTAQFQELDVTYLLASTKEWPENSFVVIKKSVEHTFPGLPFGMKSHLCRKLHCICTDYHESQMHSIEKESALMRTNAWVAWKTGEISIEELFDWANKPEQDPIRTHIIENALHISGYDLTHKLSASNNLYSIRHCATKLSISILDVENLWVCEPKTVHIRTLGANIVITKSGSDDLLVSSFDSSKSQLNPVVKSNVDVHWVHSGNGDQIRLLELEESPLIVIGDYITHYGGRLEVNRVISVDAVLENSVRTFPAYRHMHRLAILIEGYETIYNPYLPDLLRTDSAEYCYDGNTEIGQEDNTHSDDENNSTLLHDNRYKNCSASRGTTKQFYTLFATCIRGDIIVEDVTSIHSQIIVDQTPIRLNYLHYGLALISGTNGLLGVVRSRLERSNRSLNPDKVTSMDFSSSNTESYLDAASLTNSPVLEGSKRIEGSKNLNQDHQIYLTPDNFMRYNSYISLTCDQYSTNETDEIGREEWVNVHGLYSRYLHTKTEKSHSVNSIITATAFVNLGSSMYEMYRNTYCPTLTKDEYVFYHIASGDDNGVICLWKITNDIEGVNDSTSNVMIQSSLVAKPYQFESKMKCEGLTLSSSGLNMYVCLWDRLVILSVQSLQVSEAITYPHRTLYHRGNLDVFPGVHCIYAVNESLADCCINVWRIVQVPSSNYDGFMEQNSEEVALTGWIHVDLDIKGHHNGVGNSLHKTSFDIYAGNQPVSCSSSKNEISIQTLPHKEKLQSQMSFLSYSNNSITQRLHRDYMRLFSNRFSNDLSASYQSVVPFFSVVFACIQNPFLSLIASVLEMSEQEVNAIMDSWLLRDIFEPITNLTAETVITLMPNFLQLKSFLCDRIGQRFWIDVGIGHNQFCALYLKHCGNKSVAIEHPWQNYLRTFGPEHLRRSTRSLRQLTTNIRKLDETANLKTYLPRQLGYVVGLQEIYARRVGLCGPLPIELGQLSQLRVLSMGNNYLTGRLPEQFGELKNLQRIVLHQNKLFGEVPKCLDLLGCIVNLAGNPGLQHGPEVPIHEKEALSDLYASTKGYQWYSKTHWLTRQPVSKWYKVGVLSSHVHSIVMSNNNMDGSLPPTINKLSKLRMIELATMPALSGYIPVELCQITTLRRLCICRCGLIGVIPDAIGNLIFLEELQLFGNKLAGTIPKGIGRLINLKLLSLGEYTGGNNFTNTELPSCLASLSKLEALFMANCNIVGELPEWIGQLKELRQLDLQRNFLSGTIPKSISMLENLLYLNVKDNPRMEGILPIAELASLRKLNRLSLVHCNFQNTEQTVSYMQQHSSRCKVWV